MSDNWRKKMSNSNAKPKNNGGQRSGGGGGNSNRRPNSAKGNGKQTQSPLQRSTSYEGVRKIVAREGRSARNLVAWRVPMDTSISAGKGKMSNKKAKAEKMESKAEAMSSHAAEKLRSKSAQRDSSSEGSKGTQTSPRKKSPGQIKGKKADVRARYWAFLFDNLRRAVDEIYQTCEADESVVECKEMLLMLDNYSREFKALIEYIEMQKQLEKSDNWPSSLAWEVRKSPGRPLGPSPTPSERVTPSPVSRSLNFSGHSLPRGISPTPRQPPGTAVKDADEIAPAEKPQVGAPASTQVSAPVVSTVTAATGTWADKVKGSPSATSVAQPISSPDTGKQGSSTVQEEAVHNACDTDAEDSGGWETVQRGRRRDPDSRQQRPSRQATTKSARHSNSVKNSPNTDQKLNRERADSQKENRPSHRVMLPGNTSQNCRKITQNTKISDLKKANSDAKQKVVNGHPDEKTEVYNVWTQGKNKPSKDKEICSAETVETEDKGKQLEGTETGSSNEKATGKSQTDNQAKAADTPSSPTEDVVDDLLKKLILMDSSETTNGITDQEMDVSKNNGPQEKLEEGPREEAKASEKTVGENGLLPDNDEKITDKFTEEDDDDEDDDDILDSALDDTVAAIEKQEEELASKLQAYQDEAIAWAMEEERSLTKQIEEEEKAPILVDTDRDGESDLADDHSSSTIEAESTFEPKREPPLVESADLPGCADGVGRIAQSGAEGRSLPHLPSVSLDSSGQPLDWTEIMAEYEAGAQYRESTSWGEMVEDFETRPPGRALHMHEKLSSPSRKKPLAESWKKHKEKQAKAVILRERLKTEQLCKLQQLEERIKEVREWKEQLLDQRRLAMDEKLERAERKRLLQLQAVVRKAQEEEAKANEIAFINTLEAQNKRHDIMTRYQLVESRLQELLDMRQKKQEEKAAKEEAVQERRKALEAERQARVQELINKREEQEARIEQQKLEKDKAREKATRERAREREQRMIALNAAQQANLEELQKKIQMKHDESSRRHLEQLEQRREKAADMSTLKHLTGGEDDTPQSVPYEQKKICSLCTVVIASEVHLWSHLKGKKHQEAMSEQMEGKMLSEEEMQTFSLKYIKDALEEGHDTSAEQEKERQRTLKKRAKKLRSRMAARGREYESVHGAKLANPDSTHRAKVQKVVKDLNKQLQNQGTGPWQQNKVQALDRTLGEASRVMEKGIASDKQVFRSCGGMTSLSRLLFLTETNGDGKPPVIPSKSLNLVASVYGLACGGLEENCVYVLLSNKIASVVDALSHQLMTLLPEVSSPLTTSGGLRVQLPSDPVATSLMQTLSTILDCLAGHYTSRQANKTATSGTDLDSLIGRGYDLVSYVVSVGIVDKLSQYFKSVRGPIDQDLKAAEFLGSGMGLLASMNKFVSSLGKSNGDKGPKKDDTTQLIHTYQVTELVGIVSLLYGMLLHSGAPERGPSPPPEAFPPHTLHVATMGIRMLNNMAGLDLNMLQTALGEEGISLEFRHIASYLLWYCTHWTNQDLLHEVILIVGYFTALNSDNQVIVQSGRTPTVLQQLCALPFQYFSDPQLVAVLFPTLISCCYQNEQNRKILQQEISSSLLATFIEGRIQDSQQQILLPSKRPKTSGVDIMVFSARFPQHTWEDALKYFTPS
ncbi:SCAPER [Branchiostoma lanceolatum]|uniref:SCAPER protein n=1 Tax=Branchiostoma lanceolatum TaxID=7740 RepID=A0A8K0EKF3_BRALA|nr:SCAPER [Branchiostoma lanceolatum]